MTQIETIIKKITHILDESKADNIVLLPVDQLSTEFEYMIICTATSQRHVNSLVDHTSQGLKGFAVHVHTPKRSQDDWMVVDAGSIVIHIMTEKARDFYRLENLWAYNDTLDESCG